MKLKQMLLADLYLQRDYNIISILLFLKQYNYVYIVSKMCIVQLRICINTENLMQIYLCYYIEYLII